MWGIHRGPVNSPHKWPVTRKMFLFDDVILDRDDRNHKIVKQKRKSSPGLYQEMECLDMKSLIEKKRTHRHMNSLTDIFDFRWQWWFPVLNRTAPYIVQKNFSVWNFIWQDIFNRFWSHIELPKRIHVACRPATPKYFICKICQIICVPRLAVTQE